MHQPTGNGEFNMARSTLARHRKTPFLRDPDEGTGGGGNGNGDQGGGDNSNTNGGGGNGSNGGGGGFTPITSQKDFDDRLKARLDRERNKFSDYDELKAKAAKVDELQKQVETDNEKAIREAREEAAAEERKKIAPQAVRAEFRAAAKGVLTDAQRDAFLEDADLSKYLTDKGEVDIEKVEKKVKALGPGTSNSEDDKSKDKGKSKTSGRVPRDMGQGAREQGGKVSVSSAKEDYAERRRKQLKLPAPS